jgi:hypothetical protein
MLTEQNAELSRRGRWTAVGDITGCITIVSGFYINKACGYGVGA